MKITVLCENNISGPEPRGLIGEHGLAYFIEGKKNTLFDTGGGLTLENNAKILGKDLTTVERIVLSHGHYDHTAGLGVALEKAGRETPVYIHPDAFKDKAAVIEMNGQKIEVAIGMQKVREEYEAMGARFIHTAGFERLNEDISLISDIEHSPGWKSIDTRLMRREGNALISDPFTDDLSMILETSSGPVILLGCAHSGIVEILKAASKKTGYKSFHAVIGGTHLEAATEEYTKECIETMRRFKIKIISPAHCTGFQKTAEIARAMPDEYRTVSVGSVFEF